jgi:hypothetical protein
LCIEAGGRRAVPGTWRFPHAINSRSTGARSRPRALGRRKELRETSFVVEEEVAHDEERPSISEQVERPGDRARRPQRHSRRGSTLLSVLTHHRESTRVAKRKQDW